MKVTLAQVHYEDTGHNIRTFKFRTESPVDYIAGQFIELHVPHKNPDDRGAKRWFTLSSSPLDEPFITITTKITDQSSTFKKALAQLKVGSELTISDPMGDFVLPKDTSIPLLFVAGGIGLTPFHSMISWLIGTKEFRDITLLYTVNSEKELIWQKELEQYGLRKVIIVSNPLGDWDGEVGRLNGDRIIELGTPNDDSLIFISGPEPMVEALNTELSDLHIPSDRLVGDFFPGYSAI